MLMLGAIVAVAAVAVVLVSLSNLPADAPVSEEGLARYAGLARSFTEEGFPLLGDPEAPVQVSEISSFACPSCGRFYRDVTPMILGRARAGEVAFTYIPAFRSGPLDNGEGAARAALCAGEQGRFWEYHSALFEWQATFGNQAFARNRLAGGVSSLEIDRSEWDACMASSRPDAVTEAAEALLSEYGSTPTVLVNGERVNGTLAEVQAAIVGALPAA